MSDPSPERWRQAGAMPITWGDFAQRLLQLVLTLTLGFAAWGADKVYDRIEQLQATVYELTRRIDQLEPASERLRTVEREQRGVVLTLGELQVRMAVLEAQARAGALGPGSWPVPGTTTRRRDGAEDGHAEGDRGAGDRGGDPRGAARDPR